MLRVLGKMLVAVVAIATLVVPPSPDALSQPLDPDATEDVENIDKAPLSKQQKRARRAAERVPELEALVAPKIRGNGAEVAVARGHTILVPIEVPLRARPQGRVAIKVAGTSKATLRYAPWVFDVRAQEVERGQTSRRRGKRRRAKGPRWVAIGHLAIRADASAPEKIESLRGTLDVFDFGTRRTVAHAPVTHEVTIAPPSDSDDRIEPLGAAYELYAARATKRVESRAAFAPLASMPPRAPPKVRWGALPPDAVSAFEDYLEARLRASIALERLRALASVEDASTVRSAVLELGRVSSRPNVDAGRAEASGAKKSIPDLLAAARKALAGLDVYQLELLGSQLRLRGQLNRAQLASLLVLTGADSAIRGDQEGAVTDMGRATCLDPELVFRDTRPPISEAWKTVRSEGRCRTALAPVGQPTARLVNGVDTDEIVVRAEFAPDPYEIIAGGEVRLYGGGGGVIVQRSVRAKRDKVSIIEARFDDADTLRNVEGALLVEVIARDLSGVDISSVGSPNPETIEVKKADDYGRGVPWWVWLVTGVAVVGGGTAAAVILLKPEDTRGFGPIGARF